MLKVEEAIEKAVRDLRAAGNAWMTHEKFEFERRTILQQLARDVAAEVLYQLAAETPHREGTVDGLLAQLREGGR
jgi:hypothetical protein